MPVTFLPEPPLFGMVTSVKRHFLSLSALVIAILFAGCMATPVASSGGPGSITVPNTNINAVIAAAQNVFAQYGYSVGPVNYPDSISFDKPAGTFGKLMYGSYGVTTTIRAHIKIIPLAGTHDIRLITSVSHVSNAGEAGFESSTKMMGAWAGQFNPLLQKIQAQAGGVGPGM